MPCVGLMAGALLIKAFATWLKLNEVSENENEVSTDTSVQVIFTCKYCILILL